MIYAKNNRSVQLCTISIIILKYLYEWVDRVTGHSGERGLGTGRVKGDAPGSQGGGNQEG